MSGVLKDHVNKLSPKTKETAKVLAFPALLLIIYLIFYSLWVVLGLPSQSEILEITKDWFDKYGLLIVFVGAIIEGMLLFGNYFPGSLIIFLSVIAARGNVIRVLEIIVVVFIAFSISYTVDYVLGKYGWYRVLAKFGLKSIITKYNKFIEDRGLRIVFFSYWTPNLASLVATSAGILGIPFKKFLIFSTFGILLWSSFWALLIFLIGNRAIEILGFKFVIILIIIWMGFLLFRRIFKKKLRLFANFFPN